jgi:hypothetical protein
MKRILCFGDSITANSDGWIMTVNDNPLFETINAGRNGRKATCCEGA